VASDLVLQVAMMVYMRDETVRRNPRGSIAVRFYFPTRELADSCGTDMPRAKRMVQSLQDDGLVHVGRNGVTLTEAAPPPEGE
jgi:hypothetical protein